MSVSPEVISAIKREGIEQCADLLVSGAFDEPLHHEDLEWDTHLVGVLRLLLREDSDNGAVLRLDSDQPLGHEPGEYLPDGGP